MLSTSRNSPFIPHSPPHDVSKDLQWWYHTLEQPNLSWVTPGPIILNDFEAYSDASSGIGIGITIADKWRAWHLIPGWKADGRDIGWVEALGFELIIQSLCQVVREMHNSHIKVYGDNKGVVEVWWNGQSRNKPTNHVFKCIHQFTKTNKLSSTHGMLPANTTHLTTHQEGFTAPTHASSLISPSTLSYAPSLSTSMPSCTQLNSRLVTADVYFRHLPIQHGPIRTNNINPSTSDGNMRKSSSTSQPSSHSRHHIDPSCPAPYPAHLRLSPSSIRPHVLTRDRLYAWKPASSRGDNRENPLVTIFDADLQRIKVVIGESWSELT